MSLIDILNQCINEQEVKDPEIIGGTNLRAATEMVMLEVAFSPVLPFRGSTEPVEVVQTQGGDYLIRHPQFPQPVGAALVKTMRARFLLQKGAYAEEFDSLPHPEKTRVAAQYFNGLVPLSASKLRAKMMGNG